MSDPEWLPPVKPTKFGGRLVKRDQPPEEWQRLAAVLAQLQAGLWAERKRAAVVLGSLWLLALVYWVLALWQGWPGV